MDGHRAAVTASDHFQALRRTRKLLLEIATRPDTIVPASITAAIERLLATEPFCRIPELPTSEKVEAWAVDVAAEARRLEAELCAARTLLTRARRRATAVTPGLARPLEAELARHAVHREADRQRVLENLDWQQREAERRGDRATLESVAARRAEILALSVDELMEDRDTLL